VNWDEWRGSLSGDVTMVTKTLLARLGCRVDLHMFVGTDAPGCFHTHPAYAVRIILRGGYVEELEGRGLRAWRAGDIGIVPPSCSHRVAHLLGTAPAITLWLRGPKIAETQLRGEGWPGSA